MERAKGKGKAMRVVLIVVGALLIADTFFIAMRSNINLGVVAPAIMGAPLLIYGLFYPQLAPLLSHGFGRFVLVFVICIYVVVLLSLCVCGAFMATAAAQGPADDAQAVIVLGAGLRGTRLSYVFQNRLDTAFAYLESHPQALCVVTGGQGSGEDMPEAHAARDYMAGRGIDQSRIVVEDKSTSTVENLTFAKELLDGMFDDYNVVVVSSDFHIYRALRNARALGLNATGLGAPVPYYVVPNNVIRETAAILNEWVFG